MNQSNKQIKSLNRTHGPTHYFPLDMSALSVTAEQNKSSAQPQCGLDCEKLQSLTSG